MMLAVGSSKCFERCNEKPCLALLFRLYFFVSGFMLKVWRLLFFQTVVAVLCGTLVKSSGFSPHLSRRKACPAHGLMVLNRLSSDNFVQHLTSDLPVHVQPPFVLFAQHGSSEFLCF